MRWVLMVDTSGTDGAVAVADLSIPLNLQIVSERPVPGRETQERLMGSIADTVREAGLPAAVHLDLLVVVAGPGSFTGLRIGLAAVKGLAEATGKPVIAVSRLAMLAAYETREGIVHAWLDAGRGDIYAGTYEGGQTIIEHMLHRADAIAAAGENPVVIAEAALEGVHPRTHRRSMPGVREALLLAMESLQLGRFADLLSLDAHYLRVPDAELAMRAGRGVR